MQSRAASTKLLSRSVPRTNSSDVGCVASIGGMLATGGSTRTMRRSPNQAVNSTG